MHNTCTSYALVFAFSVLSACAQISAPSAPEFSVIPDRDGLAVAPSGMRIDFGRAPEGVISLLDGTYGNHIALGIVNCPNAVLQNLRWGNLILTFTDEQFVGWQQNGITQGRICAG